MFKNLIKCSIRHVQTTTEMKSDQTTNEWGKHFLYMYTYNQLSGRKMEFYVLALQLK